MQNHKNPCSKKNSKGSFFKGKIKTALFTWPILQVSKGMSSCVNFCEKLQEGQNCKQTAENCKQIFEN